MPQLIKFLREKFFNKTQSREGLGDCVGRVAQQICILNDSLNVEEVSMLQDKSLGEVVRSARKKRDLAPEDLLRDFPELLKGRTNREHALSDLEQDRLDPSSVQDLFPLLSKALDLPEADLRELAANYSIASRRRMEADAEHRLASVLYRARYERD